MEITEVLDNRRFTLDQECALQIEWDGQIVRIDPHTGAMLKLFLARPDIDVQLELWLIEHEASDP